MGTWNEFSRFGKRSVRCARWHFSLGPSLLFHRLIRRSVSTLKQLRSAAAVTALTDVRRLSTPLSLSAGVWVCVSDPSQLLHTMKRSLTCPRPARRPATLHPPSPNSEPLGFSFGLLRSALWPPELSLPPPLLGDIQPVTGRPSLPDTWIFSPSAVTPFYCSLSLPLMTSLPSSPGRHFLACSRPASSLLLSSESLSIIIICVLFSVSCPYISLIKKRLCFL